MVRPIASSIPYLNFNLNFYPDIIHVIIHSFIIQTFLGPRSSKTCSLVLIPRDKEEIDILLRHEYAVEYNKRFLFNSL